MVLRHHARASVLPEYFELTTFGDTKIFPCLCKTSAVFLSSVPPPLQPHSPYYYYYEYYYYYYYYYLYYYCYYYCSV